MMESTVINKQQHVGLQKLSALAGMLHSSLGPNKMYKFIQDDTNGELALVSSCFRIIQNLEPTCAVGQLVYETVHAQQKVYHTGSGCLLFLAGAWSRASLDCLHKGISVTHIISAMSEGMDICMDVCRKFSVSIQELAAGPSENCAATPDGLGLQLPETPITKACASPCTLQEKVTFDHKTLSIRGQRKIKLSRYFCETKSEIVPQKQQPHHHEHDIAHIAEALSHGHDKLMELAVKAIQAQSEHKQQESSFPIFDITKVVTCVLPGLPEDQTCVVKGFVVLLSDEQASVAHHLKEKSLKFALINGDLSHTYRHLGFQRPAVVQPVRHQLDLSSTSNEEEEWLENVLKLLLKLKVDLILTSGHACESVIHHCYRHRILVVEKVNSYVLKTFANSTKAVPVTYITQLSEHCVGSGMQAAVWRDICSFERKSSTAVRIFAGRTTGLVTVILTSCIYGKLQMLEDQFWACAYRLHHALKDRALLPGAGGTEMLCVRHLQKQAKCHREDTCSVQQTGKTADLYRGVVLELMAEGFIDYITTVMVNTGRFSKVKARTVVSQQLGNCNKPQDIAAKFSEIVLENKKEDTTVFSPIKPEETSAGKIYDNLGVKQEAWRKALDLVLLVLQSDAEVITGVGLKMEENLMLL